MLRELFASATHDASAAMCRWTNSLVSLTLDEVCEIPLQDVCTELNLGDELLTMVVMDLDDGVNGAMILAFTDEGGRGLAAALLDADVNNGPGWSELERSALNETGNILGCAYVNAVTRLIDCPLIPSIPHFVVDYGASVLEQALLGQVASTEKVLIGRTKFQHKSDELSWWLLFVPSVALRVTIEKSLPLITTR
jgi:chemotaxis protein CheC